MTGYAFREMQDEQVSLAVEIKGYNSRFLEPYIYLPPLVSSMEPGIREYISGRFKRGKIEINIRLKEHNSPVSVSVNREAAKAYMDAIAGLAKMLGIRKKPSLDFLLGLEGVLEIDKTRDNDRYRSIIWPVLSAALDSFEAERNREGKHTEEDILSHLSVLESSLDMIAPLAPSLEREMQETLRNRFGELLGGQIDENRILQETAALLVKYTISEEISRLKSHIDEFRAEILRNPSPGKKLDFLCQEMNREINTIGSKTQNLEVSHGVVNMKEVLENIREQLRNVE
jgi:uncharacterized protein (TIGR00255 family)